MLIEQSVLENPEFFDQQFRFESESHSDRIETLRRMQEDWSGDGEPEFCMHVRITIQV